MDGPLSMMNRIRRKEILILTFCLLIGFALRFYTFDQKSLWMDEVHTYNDSKDDLRGHLKFYKENPTYLHPPLFFIVTHLFHPFTKPERDLRIIPLIFGTLSIPMIYFLSKTFSPNIALPCTISLTFMAYHISLSQDGRSYSLIILLGIAGLYFFMKHLRTSKRRYLLPAGLLFASLFYTSYTSIPFIALSQILWLYQVNETNKKNRLSSFFVLNGATIILSIPWILFIILNYKGQTVMDPFHTEDPGSLWAITYRIFHDWVPHAPLMIASVILLILFPFFSRDKKNALVLLSVFFLPIGGLYLFCKLLGLTHFITSRYFINFLPLFFISLYLSLNAIEFRFERLRKFIRLEILFLILFVASNLVILPLYYRSEKQDLRGLVTYLKGQLRAGDKIFLETESYLPGILHYFGAYPEGRHQIVIPWKESEKKIAVKKSFTYLGKTFTLYHSKTCCAQYVADGNRLWIVVGKYTAPKITKDSPCALKGYFDGSFLNFVKFPTDASIYLFLWDPLSPNEKGIDIPIN